MKLEDAWLTLLDMDTTVVRTPSQIYSMLSDLGVFKDYPKIRLAVNSALQNGLWELVSSNSISQTDIDKLKSNLKYDGFSNVIIDEIINSFYTSPQSGINSHQSVHLQTPNNAYLKPSSLSFLGIPLGCKLDDFLAKIQNVYSIDKSRSKFHITNEDIKHFLLDCQDIEYNKLKDVSKVRCIGDFAGIKHCKIDIHYSPFSEIVYNIIIWNDCCSETYFNTISQAYENKYGTPTYKEDGALFIDKKCLFSISKFETIELGKFLGHYLYIKYLDSRWADYDDDKIKQKQEELASEMQNKIIIDGI